MELVLQLSEQNIRIYSEFPPPKSELHLYVLNSLYYFPLWRKWSATDSFPLTETEKDVLELIVLNTDLSEITSRTGLSKNRIAEISKEAIQKFKFSRELYNSWLLYERNFLDNLM